MSIMVVQARAIKKEKTQNTIAGEMTHAERVRYAESGTMRGGSGGGVASQCSERGEAIMGKLWHRNAANEVKLSWGNYGVVVTFHFREAVQYHIRARCVAQLGVE